MTNDINVDHLDFYKNKASWSYIENYQNLDLKLLYHTEIMLELLNYLKKEILSYQFLFIHIKHQLNLIKNSLYKKIWKEFCLNKCYKFIDAYSPFFDEAKNKSINYVMEKYYIKGDSHFNEYGNKKIYDILKFNLN